MTNNNNELGGNAGGEVGNVPQTETSSSSKLKDYGQRSLSPFVDLIHRYKGDIGPYITALGKGLQAACDSFESTQEKSGAEKVVSGWFSEVNNWFNTAREKVESSDEKDFLRFLENEARERPAVMFSSSYIAGLLFGRMGRHMIRLKNQSAETSQLH